jgi:hypothetical protein
MVSEDPGPSSDSSFAKCVVTSDKCLDISELHSFARGCAGFFLCLDINFMEVLKDAIRVTGRHMQRHGHHPIYSTAPATAPARHG